MSEVKLAYEVDEITTHKTYKNIGCLVSQPLSYFGCHFVLHACMIVFYIFPGYEANDQIFIAIGLAHATVFILLVLLATKDPGSIPKILANFEHQKYQGIPMHSQSHYLMLQLNEKTYLQPNATHSLRIKFCRSCNIFRPPRTSHCPDCNMCVEKYDHHCPWIGICIGKKNYRFFFTFIICLAGMLTLTFTQSVCFLIITEFSKENRLKIAAGIFVGTASFLVMSFMYLLTVLHLYFISTNVTTYEYFKGSWDKLSGIPNSSNSCFKNLFRVLCGFNSKNKLNLHSRLIEREDLPLTVKNRNQQVYNAKESVEHLRDQFAEEVIASSDLFNSESKGEV